MVKVEADGKPLLLATDRDTEAELVALIYRYRWQIELFFKWFKAFSAAARQTGHGAHPLLLDGLRAAR